MSWNDYSASVKKAINTNMSWLKDQSVCVPMGQNGLVLESQWYFTQQCYSTSNYWYALLREIDTYGFDSTTALDYDEWMDTLCQNWMLCEAKME